jgi:RNA polymerase sigma-70 factor (ECF subfamily)
MTVRKTCLVGSGSQSRANWIEAFLGLTDYWTSRWIFDIAIVARFADRPHGSTQARSNHRSIMAAKEGLQSEPRPKASEFVACISRIANDRDQAAFEFLFRFFAPRIKSYCLKLGADDSAAEEITQEAMVSIWRNAGQFDPSRAAPSTWVFTIARNLVIDRFRKSRRPQFDFNDPALVPDDQLPPDRLIEQTELQENIRKIMGALSSNERDVLMLSFFENLSHFEISRRLSLPVGTVKSRIRLAFGKIRIKLEAQDGAGE